MSTSTPTPFEPDDNEPDPSFWRTYSPHLELPISALTSIFVHVLMLAVLVGLLLVAMQGPDTKPVPIAMAEGGMDESGFGSPGSAGGADKLASDKPAEVTPQDIAALPLNKPLPDVKEDLTKAIAIDDPSAVVPLTDEKAAAFGALDEDLQKKLLEFGKRGSGQGSGSATGAGQGTGPSGQEGVGIGGTGTDSTRSRTIRWTLQFQTASGRDYLNQLKSLGAVVLVPVPPGNKQMYIFRNLDNPVPGTILTEPEWQELSKQIRFSDIKRESVVGVGQALNLDFTPDVFWAFFPKGVEEELARLEQSYRGLRTEQIAETKFKVTMRSGRYEFAVAEQRRK